MTMPRRVHVRSYLLVFFLAGLIVVPLAPLGLNIYDEGVRLYGADRVLRGETPYHDFFAYYGPGGFYFWALLFKMFGVQIIVARLAAVFLIALAAVSVFALARSAALSWPWAVIPVVALILPFRSGSDFVICDPALALVLAAGAVLSIGRGRLPTYLGAGALVGLAATFRHDFALYGAIAAAVTTLCHHWHGLPHSGDATSPERELLADVWRPAALVAGMAVVIIPVYGLLALRGPQVLIEMLLTNPRRLMVFRRLPYGYYELRDFSSAMAGGYGFAKAFAEGPTLIVLLAPPLALGLCLSLLAWRTRRRILQRDGAIAPLLFVTICALGLAVYALGRGDWYHVYPLYVLSALAGTIVAAPREPNVRRASTNVAIASIIAAIVWIAALAVIEFWLTVPLHVPRADAIRVRRDQAWLADAVRDVSRYAGFGPIFVAAERHDRVHANAPVIYFLADRRSGTYFHDYIPGLTTSREVQQRIVSDLITNKVRTVIIAKTPLPNEPNPSRISSGISLLDDYLRSAFSPIRDTDRYRLLDGGPKL